MKDLPQTAGAHAPIKNDAQLRALKPAEGGEYTVGVVGAPGLRLRVTPDGAKRWVGRVKVSGTVRTRGLGAYPTTSLAQVRERWTKERAALRAGRDLKAEGEALKARSGLTSESTLAELAASWVDGARSGWKNPAEAGDREAKRLRMHLLDPAKPGAPNLGRIQIRSLTHGMLKDRLTMVERSHPTTAVKVAGLAEQMLQWAFGHELIQSNVGAGLRKHFSRRLAKAEVRHHAAVLDEREFGQLLSAIDAYPGTAVVQAALWLHARLPVRSGELRLATWGEFTIDGDTPIWTIAATRMKAGREHLVPLADQIVERLLWLREVTGVARLPTAEQGARLVLPSLRTRESDIQRPISENTICAALRGMGFDGDTATCHGFRSSFRTLAGRAGEGRMWSREALELSLAHSVMSKVEAAYDRDDRIDERRRIMDWWAAECDRLARASRLTLVPAAAAEAA